MHKPELCVLQSSTKFLAALSPLFLRLLRWSFLRPFWRLRFLDGFGLLWGTLRRSKSALEFYDRWVSELQILDGDLVYLKLSLSTHLNLKVKFMLEFSVKYRCFYELCPPEAAHANAYAIKFFSPFRLHNYMASSVCRLKAFDESHLKCTWMSSHLRL